MMKKKNVDELYMVKSHNWLFTSMIKELLTGVSRTTPAGGQNWT